MNTQRIAHMRLALCSSALGIAATIALTVTGCGYFDGGIPTGKVTGSLSLKGKPVNSAAVTFYSAVSGSGASTNLQSDGSFTFAQPLPVGKYTVMVSPPASTLEPGNKETDAARLKELKAAKAALPAKYRTAQTSDLEVEVAQGDNSFDLNMQ